jgi:hypothetical protein
MKPANVIITFPHCMRKIALDEVLTHQIRDQLEKEFKKAMNRAEGDE